MFYCVKPSRQKLEIKRSVFIAISEIIEDRVDAKEKLSRIRAEFSDATHVCSAFIADEVGDDFGYDDDGEPSGTAGKPIYSALAAAGARRSMIAVVRYFGGIKLGAGGLTRTYRESAAGLIESAGLVKAEKTVDYAVRCCGDAFKRISQVARNAQYKIDGIVYNDRVDFTLTAPFGSDIVAVIAPFGAEVIGRTERISFVSE